MKGYAQRIMERLDREKIVTWFDIGFFLDRLKRGQPVRQVQHNRTFGQFKTRLSRGIAFITYRVGTDGVSIEMFKYATALGSILGNNRIKTHWLVGEADAGVDYFKHRPGVVLKVFPELRGFENWGQPYQWLFYTKLKRGSREYIELPKLIWDETKTIVKLLLGYFEENSVELILAANVSSNPGNLSLMLALVIVSELYNMPVIGANHDFYWEGGGVPRAGKKRGPRDHFFRNHDLGEIFSLIQVLYPWDSPRWFHANINTLQTKVVLRTLGINPERVTTLTTAINTNIFRPYQTKEKTAVWQKLNLLFGADQNNIISPNHPDYAKIAQRKEPILIGNTRSPIQFGNRTTLLLQPTRIIARKRIEETLAITKKLASRRDLWEKSQSIVLIITGEVAGGADHYFKKLLFEIKKLMSSLGNGRRLYIGFKFGKDSNAAFNETALGPLRMSELYGVSTLAFLPSETEGRGLPILESAASGVPLVINRFYPLAVYQEVIGVTKAAAEQLRVIEIPTAINDPTFITKIIQIATNRIVRHNITYWNRRVVRKRFSIGTLALNFDSIIKTVFLASRGASVKRAIASRSLFLLAEGASGSRVHQLLYDKNRPYIPGLMKLRFLSSVKSIIDPTYFRIEEKELKSRIYDFALSLVPTRISQSARQKFFGAVEQLFNIKRGHYPIAIDTTFDYRYRSNERYLWHEFTESGLLGVVADLARALVSRESPPEITLPALSRLVSRLRSVIGRMLAAESSTADELEDCLQRPLIIDDSDFLLRRVFDKPQSLVIFPGQAASIFSELIVYEAMVKHWSTIDQRFSITFACPRDDVFGVTARELDRMLRLDQWPSLKKAYLSGQLNVLESGSQSAGPNVSQLSVKVQQALINVKRDHGHVLAKGEHAYLSLDVLDIDSFRFATIQYPITMAVFQHPGGGGFLQFVPAGLRPFFSFPVTVETPTQFSHVLRSKLMKGNPKAIDARLEKLKVHLDSHGTSLRSVLQPPADSRSDNQLSIKRLAGKYRDDFGWTGAAVRLPIQKGEFHVVHSRDNRTLPQFVSRIERRLGGNVLIGWNGGYILNTELVAKLGISEDFIGVSLGFLVSNSRVINLPLFRRPAFGVLDDGKVFIDFIELNFSGRILLRGQTLFSWNRQDINPGSPPDGRVAVYTPGSGKLIIPSHDRLLVTIGGNRIVKISVSRTRVEPLFPGGVTFSVPGIKKSRLKNLAVGSKITLDLDLPEPWSRVTEALEAGPLLVKNGRPAIRLDQEGWRLPHSIATQAARRDRENERGPRIGCGLNQRGELICVVVEGRVRDSVGATYQELATALIKEGAHIAMGFDPGGSASLYTHRGVVNIVPYSSSYNENPRYGKPEPRPVGNAILYHIKRPRP